MRLLCLSNGHGEDAIALRILRELQPDGDRLQIAALPLVGEGRAFANSGIPIVGAVKQMPSGGFIYMDGRQLARDLRGGLISLTLKQLQTARAWAKDGGTILAVGDIVPLLFAWWSGAPYAFVGTAKSEYYLRDEAGLLPRRSWFERLENWSGSVYLPWERWLMSRDRCKAVFPRDTLTTTLLKQWDIPAFDLGNPMMDGLEVTIPSSPSQDTDHPMTLVLLPGSRAPEAYENWQQLLSAITGIIASFRQRPVRFLGAIAPTLDLDILCQPLQAQGWQRVSAPDDPVISFSQRNATLVLSQSSFANWLHQADFAIAMAGTATEQFVGLGKPALILPGKGPQFTPAFAEAQTRLLGPSVTLVKHPTQIAQALDALLNNPDRLQLIAENGLRRMGEPGAAKRIANCLLERLL